MCAMSERPDPEPTKETPAEAIAEAILVAKTKSARPPKAALRAASDAAPLRARFVMELAKRLHQYGTGAHRLEGAIDKCSRLLKLDCQLLSTPTSIILSFTDLAGRGKPIPAQVLRMSPGDINLSKLSQVDDIAEQVLTNRLDLRHGYKRLRDLHDRPSKLRDWLTLLSFGLCGATVAILLRTSWIDVAGATLIGLSIGAIAWICGDRPRFAGAIEPLAALLATLLAYSFGYLVPHLAAKQVIMASLIVLLPGMSLTIALTELSTQHLISGVARMAGALATLLKLSFGVVMGTELARALGIFATSRIVEPVAEHWVWLSLPVAGFAFAVLFRAAWRDFGLVIAAVIFGYCSVRVGSMVSNDFAVFFAGMMVASAANLYARVWKRPGALIRLPGIILLVPGSIGYRSLSFMLEKNLESGVETLFALLTALISLCAGMLFGNLLVPPRSNL
jgi:uncharacterized membrane protein YjjP (DUF1212 family)